MKKNLLMLSVLFFAISGAFAQTDNYWKSHADSNTKIATQKLVLRESFPKEFKLYDLNFNNLKQQLYTVVDGRSSNNTTIISMPNADGKLEQFEMYEASNFEPALQARFPEIRAFSGKGITDKYATLKLSISPLGIQTMVFRTDKENEFMEPYSQDYAVYAVYKSNRLKNNSDWKCSTPDEKLEKGLLSNRPSITQRSSDGNLRVMRLAQSCTGEYAAFFGASTAGNASDQTIVLTAINNTLTRCNGVYEKDLALHLNLVANSTAVFYYNAATDPYATVTNASAPPASWNANLQTTLTNNIGEANYDIGHLFGASGGGGNAGCIGCVCVDGTKGRGITSPATGTVNSSTSFPPAGDTFDIDYVTHEVGHQLGANHTFSNSNEGSGVNKEVGSGITIMGYAGITGQDIAPHSIDIYHQASIAQIQTNLGTKACPVTTNISANNATPVVNPVSNYTIPKSTPFVLTGSASDANAGDALTYCWEQNDDGGTNTGAASSASTTKTSGPNFISWPATASPSRYFPTLSSILANSPTTGLVATPGDAGMLSEALSSVARTLNFRLTVRDNVPYSSIAPLKVGQTSYTDMAVTVAGGAGPFVVNSPNTAVSWAAGTNQTVTWDVAGTTSNGVNTSFVDIFLSTDGGLTYPIQLANKVPNDGDEVVSIPNNTGSNNRIMVKGNQNVFFDISNANFTVAAPTATFNIAQSSVQSTTACTLSSTTYTFDYKALNGFAAATTFSASGVPAGANVSFTPATMTTDGPVTMTITNLTGAPAGNYAITVTGTSGATTKIVPFYLYLGMSTIALATPADNATAQNISVPLTWTPNPSATSYDVQVATDAAFTNIISSTTVASTTYTVSGLAQGTNYYWRVLGKNASCVGTYGSTFKFTTGIIGCATTSSTNVPLTISAAGTPTVLSTLNISSGGQLSDVNVTMNVKHSYVSDLTVSLISPSATEVVLFSGSCTSNNNINATFDDSGTALVCTTSTGTTTYAVSGTITPTQSLSGFNGQTASGTWTLKIYDAYDTDGGSLDSWSLNLCTLSALGVNDNEFTNFNLYPNPNKGNFNIKFTTENASDVKIAVIDMRGRQVFEKAYENNGVFDQNINLDNVQAGIYLVSITDGTKKTVRRVIIE